MKKRALIINKKKNIKIMSEKYFKKFILKKYL